MAQFPAFLNDSEINIGSLKKPLYNWKYSGFLVSQEKSRNDFIEIGKEENEQITC